MKLATAEIRESVSMGEDGSFFAHVRGHGKRMIVYTSPFKAGEFGGMAFPPLAPETILVCQPDDETQMWFYLSTVFRNPQGKAYGDPVKDEQQAQINKVDKDIYKSKGIPMKWVLASPEGHKIVFAEEEGKKPEEIPHPDSSHGGELNVQLENEEEWENKRLEIISSKGKALKFLDSKDQECIYLINEHRDGLKITSELSNPQSAARSIELESLGPIKTISREGQIDMWVDDGKEINIINNSTGLNTGKLTDETPDSHGEEEWYGNINLESKYSDVNLQAMAPGGRIFLRCPNEGAQLYGSSPFSTPTLQTIELETRGEDSIIRIYSKGSVQIRAESGDLDFGAAGDCNINVDGEVNINGTMGVRIDSGDSSDINLNSGPSPKVSVPMMYPYDPVIRANRDDWTQRTYYNDKGVFEQ